jgi:Antitoxin Xre/MbcA/ParS C-terminal toxin-binding domain
MPGRVGLTNDELLAKLDLWLATLPEPPSIFDVLETRDGDLIGAYILRAFRRATREAVLSRLESASATFPIGQERYDGRAVFRLFDGFVRAWSLTQDEQCGLLGLANRCELERMRNLSDDELPIEIIERSSYLLDIYLAINTLLPDPDRARSWVRAPNKARLFGGETAMRVMTESLEGLRAVNRYLRSQVSGS